MSRIEQASGVLLLEGRELRFVGSKAKVKQNLSKAFGLSFVYGALSYCKGDVESKLEKRPVTLQRFHTMYALESSLEYVSNVGNYVSAV